MNSRDDDDTNVRNHDKKDDDDANGRDDDEKDNDDANGRDMMKRTVIISRIV